MIIFRLIAIMAWLATSTLSVTASEHDASHVMGGADRPATHAMHTQASSMPHDHAAMMAAHGAPESDENDDCDESCCDGLCLCGAAPAPAAIAPPVVMTKMAPPVSAKYDFIQQAADAGMLRPEGPPPRLV